MVGEIGFWRPRDNIIHPIWAWGTAVLAVGPPVERRAGGRGNRINRDLPLSVWLEVVTAIVTFFLLMGPALSLHFRGFCTFCSVVIRCHLDTPLKILRRKYFTREHSSLSRAGAKTNRKNVRGAAG